MHISEADKDPLKTWLVGVLESICDQADPDVLASYVIALLGGHNQEDGFRDYCVEQLREFLGAETEAFVDRMLRTLEEETYKRGAAPMDDVEPQSESRDVSRIDFKEDQDDGNDSSDDRDTHHRRRGRSPSDHRDRRGSKDFDDFDNRKRRRFPEPALGDVRDERDDRLDREAREYRDTRPNQYREDARRDHRRENHLRDPPPKDDRVRRSPLDAYRPALAQPPRGREFGRDMPEVSGRRPREARPHPDRRGHGSMPMGLPGIPHDAFMMPFHGPPPPDMMMMGAVFPGVHPMMPGMMMPGLDMMPIGHGMDPMGPRRSRDRRVEAMRDLPAGRRLMNVGPGPIPSARSTGGFAQQCSPPASGSLNTYSNPHSSFVKHTIKCTGIPAHVSVAMLTQHFSQFGKVLQTEMNSQSGVQDDKVAGGKKYGEAYVQFATAEAANKCFSSPIPVLNNRFIKVVFADHNLSDPEIAPHEEVPSQSGEANEQGSSEPDTTKSLPVLKRKASAGESATLRQYEQLKSLRQKQEDIVKQKQQLLQKQIDQYQMMITKLNENGGIHDESLLKSLEEKLHKTELELKNVHEGGDLGNPAQDGNRWSPPSSFRGRAGRRGRRGGRWAGRGRALHVNHVSPWSGHTLDNRSKTIAISNVPEGFTTAMAQAHFERFGIVAEVSSDSDTVFVKFDTRATAELALKAGSFFNGQHLSMAWHTEGNGVAHSTLKDGSVALGETVEEAKVSQPCDEDEGGQS